MWIERTDVNMDKIVTVNWKENVKPPSDNQIKFATEIAETLGLNLPKEENYYEYQDFIWKNERDYRFVKEKDKLDEYNK